MDFKEYTTVKLEFITIMRNVFTQFSPHGKYFGSIKYTK